MGSTHQSCEDSRRSASRREVEKAGVSARWRRGAFGLAAILAGAVSFSACDRLALREPPTKTMEAARKKASAGDFRAAIKLYEDALDGTPATAEAHYRLALLYDDKLQRPRDALHHFERYLELAPDGPFNKEAKVYRKEGELKLMTALNKGSFVSQQEAARLKNENLSLRKRVVELVARRDAVMASSPLPKAADAKQKPIPPGARTHTVVDGETLASIATKYYKNAGRWKDIQDANFNRLEGTVKIKPGQKLIIP
jgi:nucleoid-associated protein YgaU